MTEPAPSPTDPSLPGTPLAEVSRVPFHVEPKSPRWIAPTALVISLLAAAGAGWALFKPAPTPAGTISDPKAHVCSVFETVSTAVSIQTKRAPGPDLGPVAPVAAEAIAANARLAMSAGASYLLDELPPNAPKELADQVRSFAGDLNGLAVNALAGIPNDKEPQAGLLRSAEETNKKIVELCKQ
ncbi:MAG: hypothetical protein QG655_964 [Actinomycetota bacterium]|jgi:hypothetical protein|nr:hypothetical protein [Actinomycetota bacterium]TXI39994.1 MAG: hypothetical protein E6Q56_05915 [Mycobacterium sp.]HPY24337.1 hypothetical protein [Mycobacterium sp.]